MSIQPTHRESKDVQTKGHRPPVTVTVGNARWTIGDPHTSPDPSESQAESQGDSGAESHWTLPSASARPIEDVLAGTPTQAVDRLSVPTVHRPAERFTVLRPRHRSRIKNRRRIRETFQLGCLLGLVLGCLTMVLFHQMDPALPEQAVNASAQPVLLTSTAHSFRVPATDVALLQSSAFASRAAATAKAQQLVKQGVPALIHQDGGKYEIWTGIAVRSSHLQAQKNAAAKGGVHVTSKSLDVAVQSIPALASAKPQALDAVSEWLSSAASALTALTAAESDGGVPKDAQTAYNTARKLAPSTDVLNATGRGDILQKFRTELEQAFASYGKHQSAAAMIHTLGAYDALSALRM